MSVPITINARGLLHLHFTTPPLVKKKSALVSLHSNLSPGSEAAFKDGGLEEVSISYSN